MKNKKMLQQHKCNLKIYNLINKTKYSNEDKSIEISTNE